MSEDGRLLSKGLKGGGDPEVFVNFDVNIPPQTFINICFWNTSE